MSQHDEQPFVTPDSWSHRTTPAMTPPREPFTAELYDWMPEARQTAAQCWCDDETSSIEMDSVLAEAVARRIAVCLLTGAMFARNEEFYRGLLDQCAHALGIEAFTADDGGVHDSPLRLKVPELVARTLRAHARLREALQSIAKSSCCGTCQEAALVAKVALEQDHD